MSALQVLVREYGYLSLLITLFLDGSGLPWPTEATLVLAGLAVKAGHMTWLLSWGAALLGGTAGSALSYYLGARLGHDALRNLLGTLRMPVSTLDKVDAWFERHGDRAVFFARSFPLSESWSAIPPESPEWTFAGICSSAWRGTACISP